ncbi:uncharacterized protein B0T23DRAFT_177926 [Neurospora hispaniola]|uniref:Uncharacterized protein n=1 Tax=Neurospora hispaniola TaxID=588809 RepID=A0AAJ0I715_9PEZI|nr:hypothetical protein B0T23DRAFT_177926 [Neurospora hispaniola]
MRLNDQMKGENKTTLPVESRELDTGVLFHVVEDVSRLPASTSPLGAGRHLRQAGWRLATVIGPNGTALCERPTACFMPCFYSHSHSTGLPMVSYLVHLDWVEICDGGFGKCRRPFGTCKGACSRRLFFHECPFYVSEWSEKCDNEIGGGTGAVPACRFQQHPPPSSNTAAVSSIAGGNCIRVFSTNNKIATGHCVLMACRHPDPM